MIKKMLFLLCFAALPLTAMEKMVDVERGILYEHSVSILNTTLQTVTVSYRYEGSADLMVQEIPLKGLIELTFQKRVQVLTLQSNKGSVTILGSLGLQQLNDISKTTMMMLTCAPDLRGVLPVFKQESEFRAYDDQKDLVRPVSQLGKQLKKNVADHMRDLFGSTKRYYAQALDKSFVFSSITPLLVLELPFKVAREELDTRCRYLLDTIGYAKKFFERSLEVEQNAYLDAAEKLVNVSYKLIVAQRELNNLAREWARGVVSTQYISRYGEGKLLFDCISAGMTEFREQLFLVLKASER